VDYNEDQIADRIADRTADGISSEYDKQGRMVEGEVEVEPE